MRKIFMTAVALILLLATLLVGCNNAKPETTIGETESATATIIESTESAVENILIYVKGIKDLTVEQNAENVDYMKNITYDKKYIKSVKADSSKVDVTTVGTYELVYTITPVDINTSNVTVTKNVTVEVVTNDDVHAEADNNEVVITDNGETKKASDGTTSVETSKPTENSSESTKHTHNWVPITETITVTDSPATTKQELVREAYDETVVDEDARVLCFIYDGHIITSPDEVKTYLFDVLEAKINADIESGALIPEPGVIYGNWGTMSIWNYYECYPENTISQEELELYDAIKTVHHDAVYKTVKVPAVTHTQERVVGYRCSECGATK